MQKGSPAKQVDDVFTSKQEVKRHRFCCRIWRLMELFRQICYRFDYFLLKSVDMCPDPWKTLALYKWIT